MRNGKRVSILRKVDNNTEFNTGGTYQQYCIAEAMTVNPIPDDLDFDIASMNFVNPLTAIGLVESA